MGQMYRNRAEAEEDAKAMRGWNNIEIVEEDGTVDCDGEYRPRVYILAVDPVTERQAIFDGSNDIARFDGSGDGFVGRCLPQRGVATMTHTPGPWKIDHERIGPWGEPVVLLCDTNAPAPGTVVEWPRMPHESVDDAENEANARLISMAPELLTAIELAGRMVGQVLDSPQMTAGERAYALSRASDALGPIYYKATGTPLEWWIVG